MDDLVKKYCPNCSQTYTLKSLSPLEGKLPLFLGCGHSMCEDCIGTMVKFLEPIDCTVCHQNVKVNTENVVNPGEDKTKLYKLFPVNIQMLGELALQFLQKNSETNKPSEEDCFIDLHQILKSSNMLENKCVECQNNTSQMCQQCSTVLCETCFNKSHNNFVVFRNHVLQEIEKELVTKNCTTHKDKPLDYYCKDCGKPICISCLMVGGDKSCKNHDTVAMDDMNDIMMTKLLEVTPQVDETFRRLTKTAVDIGQLLLNLQNESASSSNLNQVIGDIEQHFSKLYYMMQKHKQEVISLVTTIKTSNKVSLCKAKTDILCGIIKAKNVLDSIKLMSNLNKLKQINLPILYNEAKEVVNIPWYLKEDKENKETLKVAVNEKLCGLICDYIYLEGNATTTYKLCPTTLLGHGVEIPPPPVKPVFPPQPPKDLRQKKQSKVKEEPNETSQPKKINRNRFYCWAPNYHSKSGSISSINSSFSDKSRNIYYNNDGEYSDITQEDTPVVETEKQIQPGSQELIYVSHIVNPHLFYVQRSCHQALVKEMLREFCNAATLPKPSLKGVTNGKIYLVFNRADKLWQRCQIMSVDKKDPNKPVFHVFCIDFGSQDSVSLDKLRLLTPARQKHPHPLAINCTLANCKPRTGHWTTDDSVLMQKIIDNKQAIIQIHDIDTTAYIPKVECDLITFEGGISIAHALAFHNRAQINNPKLPYPVVLGACKKPKIFMNNDDYPYKSNEDVIITHITSPDNFYVRKCRLQDVYDKMSQEMNHEYNINNKAGMVYLPEKGMVCAVSAGGAWQRGVVSQLEAGARVRVLLPDAGAALLLHYAALRHLHHKFTVVRALAVKCHLAGVTPLNNKWNKGAVDLMHSFENKILSLRVENNRSRESIAVTVIDKSSPEIDVCINDLMVEYKYAVKFGVYAFNKNKETRTIKNEFEDKTYSFAKHYPPKEVIDKKSTATRKSTSNEIIEADLKAIDKGPLRLEVKVLNCASPSLIYVALIHQEKSFNMFFEKLQNFYSENDILSKDWKVGDKCCTICIQSQTWRRALILELEVDNAKVFYTDFAVVETVPLINLKELQSDFASIGDAAIKCHLCGVVPAIGEEWPSITKEYLITKLNKYKRIFITKLGKFKNNSMPIEIWVYETMEGGALEPNESQWKCINKKIIARGFGIPDKTNEGYNTEQNTPKEDDTLSFLNIQGSVLDWLQLEPLPTKLVPMETEARSSTESTTPTNGIDKISTKQGLYEVMLISDWLPPEPLDCKEFIGIPTYVDNDAVIYLHNKKQRETLDIIRRALDFGFKGPDPKAKYFKWNINEPCIALFPLDNRFYRGKVLEVNYDTSICVVYYIDYGNTEECKFVDMRKSILLHQIPTQTYKCILSDIQPTDKHWDRQTLDYIHKSIVEKECLIKVAGEKINDLIPIRLKFDKLWMSDHLVDFGMAVYHDGSKPVVRKYAPSISADLAQMHDITDTDSGPDYIIVEQEDSHGTLDQSSTEKQDWNEMLEETEATNIVIGNFIKYPNNLDDTFQCNVTLINDTEILQLSLIQDDETNAIYDAMYQEIHDEIETLPPLNGIYENKACVALFPEDNLWYRAIILEYSVIQTKIKVRYVDYGNIEVITLANVKEIKEEWTKLLPATVAVKLHNVQLNPNVDIKTVIQEYSDIFLDKGPFLAKVIKNDTYPAVELRNDDGKLVYEDLFEKKLFLKCE